MLTSNSEFQSIRQQLEHLKSEDIRFEELGAGKEFAPAHTLKNQFVEKLISIINRMESYTISLTDSFEKDILQILYKYTENLNSRIIEIKKTAIEYSSNPQGFPANRQAQIDAISNNFQSFLSALEKYELQFRIFDLEEKNRIFDPKSLDSELKKMLEEIKKAELESKTILNSLKSNTIKTSVDLSENKFRILFTNHQNLERIWLIISILLMSILGILISFFISALEETKTNYVTFLIELGYRSIKIIPLSLLLRFTLGKFNIERNLRLIYEHRATIFEQFKIFEAGIGDDKETRGKFLLDLSKNLFADPATGYLKDKTNDININPIVSIIEKIAKP